MHQNASLVEGLFSQYELAWRGGYLLAYESNRDETWRGNRKNPDEGNITIK